MKGRAEKAISATNAVIDNLQDRDGFNAFWDAVDKADVKISIASIIANYFGSDLDTYQRKAHETSLNVAIGGDATLYPVLGLCNEAGELAGKVKKIYRDRGGVIGREEREALKGELGDCLYYIAEAAYQFGFTLAEVAHANNVKLADRAARGVIGGSGDNR